jgi:NAD-dependent dihydropyrimidine dehydrogenase PreA subunit
MKNKLRLALQFLFFGAVLYVGLRPVFDKGFAADFEKYCPFGGIGSLFSKLNRGTMSCTMGEVQVALGVGLLLGVLLVGKLFCSHICPVGTVGEWLGRLGATCKVRLDLPGWADRPLRALKYVLLFVTLYFTATASELFCKKFDPYFATANLFHNRDLVLYYAIPALAIVALGSVFLRLSWCRYLCPLGAVSNVFLNVVGAGTVVTAFVVAKLAGAHLSYIWLIAGLALAGLITELGWMRSLLLPLPRIVRNEETCTGCGNCDQSCPQGIAISKGRKVTHIDCTLCTDCVYACPGQHTLEIQGTRHLRYLAPASVVLLVLASLGASTQFTFTTLSSRWADFASLKNVQMYKRTGLKNVKCYGSSVALRGKLKTVPGIVGLDTYASSHTVKVYYDPGKISEGRVMASLFSPMREQVRVIAAQTPRALSVYEVGVAGMFDSYDFVHLYHALKNNEGIYGIESRYGEPVMVSVFFDADKTAPPAIKQDIETKQIQMPVNAGKAVETVKINFRTVDSGKVSGELTIPKFKKRMFKTYDSEFNDYAKYKKEQLSAFIFAMPEAGSPRYRRALGLLVSHLSADDAVVRFSTRHLEVPSGIIFFDGSKTDVEKIKKALAQPRLTVFITDTKTKEMENPFHIKPEGKVVSATELNLDEEDT